MCELYTPPRASLTCLDLHTATRLAGWSVRLPVAHAGTMSTCCTYTQRIEQMQAHSTGIRRTLQARQFSCTSLSPTLNTSFPPPPSHPDGQLDRKQWLATVHSVRPRPGSHQHYACLLFTIPYSESNDSLCKLCVAFDPPDAKAPISNISANHIRPETYRCCSLPAIDGKLDKA